MSLRFRLNLMIALTLAVIVGAGGLFALYDARRSVRDEIQSSLNLALQLIDAAAQDSDAAARQRWLSHLQHLESTRHLRIHLEPDAPWWLTPPASTAAEAAPAWFRWAVEPAPLSAQRSLTLADGQPISVTIEATPRDELAEAWRETRGFFGLLAVLATALLALVYITLGRAFAAVGGILDGLQHMEAGHYDQRLPLFEVSEFARIAAAFNHAAEALDKTRQENRALTRRLLNLQEAERRSVARELHDELGQSLSAMKALAVSLRRASHDPALLNIANAQVELCDHLFPVVRDMMQRLRPPALEELGLTAALQDLLDGWQSRCPHMEWQLTSDAAIDELPESAQIAVFRVVQEALNNVVKHADAQHVSVCLHSTPIQVCLSIRDDGHGFEVAQVSGLGLSGMRERIHGLNGQFSLTSTAHGSCVSAEIPWS